MRQKSQIYHIMIVAIFCIVIQFWKRDNFNIEYTFFLKVIIIDGPLGKSKHYTIRLEFQIGGSPHVHLFISVIRAPKRMLHNVDEYINCVHNIVCGYFLDPKVDSILYELVKTYKSIGIQKLVGDTKMVTVVFILIDFS